MAQIKLAFNQNKPCFQHDGGSGYIETGNRLILNSMDEAFQPGGEKVDYLTGHRRRVDIHFSPALYPQNWTAAYTETGCVPLEITQLNGLMESLNEHIAARQDLALNQFFLYFTVAYDFQLVWATDDAATLTPPAAAQPAQPAESITLKMVHATGKPVFALLVGSVGVYKKGQILRLFPKPALKEEKCDSIDIGIVPMRTLEGSLSWTSGVKINNYGNIPSAVLNQEYWGPILTGIDEAIAENREMDFSEMVEFLRDSFLIMVADHTDDQAKADAPAPAAAQPNSAPRMSAQVMRARARSRAEAAAEPDAEPDAPPPAPVFAAHTPRLLSRKERIVQIVLYVALALFLCFLLGVYLSNTAFVRNLLK